MNSQVFGGGPTIGVYYSGQVPPPPQCRDKQLQVWKRDRQGGSRELPLPTHPQAPPLRVGTSGRQANVDRGQQRDQALDSSQGAQEATWPAHLAGTH